MTLRMFKDYLAEQSGLPPLKCRGSWRVVPTFTVADDGTISGAAEATLVSGPSCTGANLPNATAATYQVSGEASADALELRFSSTGFPAPGDSLGFDAAMHEPITAGITGPGQASGSISIAITENGAFPVTADGIIRLRCTSCSS